MLNTPVGTQGSPGLLRLWPLAVSVVLLLGSTAAGAWAIVSRTGGRFIYALDDAYIHMAMAMNLARHGVWGCTPFRFSGASSSPLWTATLGAIYAVSGVHELTPLVLNLACAVATLVVADAALGRLQAGPWTRLATLTTLVLAVPLPSMVLFGMEHVSHLCLTLAFGALAVRALVAPDAETAAAASTTRWLAVLAALLAASRYEGLFLVGLVAALSASRGWWGRAAIVVLAAMAPHAVLGAYSIANRSFALPNSLMLKAGGEAASFWALLFKPLTPDVSILANNPPLAWLTAGGGVATLAGCAAARTLWRPWIVAPLVVTGMVLLHVHYTLSSTFWVYRYDAYLIGASVVTAGAIAAGLGAGRARWPRLMDAALGLAVVGWGGVLSADLGANVFPAQEVASATMTFREHYRAADFVRSEMPGEVVLVNDVGAMAFFSGAHTLDVFGLCDVEPVRLRREGRYEAPDLESWTLPYRPFAAIVQLSWGWMASRIPRDWQKVADIEIEPGARLLGVFDTSPDGRNTPAIRAMVERYYGPRAGEGYRLRLY